MYRDLLAYAERLFIRYSDNLIINLCVERIRNETGTNSLNLVRSGGLSGKNRAGVRLNRHDADSRILLLEVLAASEPSPPTPNISYIAFFMLLFLSMIFSVLPKSLRLICWKR